MAKGKGKKKQTEDKSSEGGQQQGAGPSQPPSQPSQPPAAQQQGQKKGKKGAGQPASQQAPPPQQQATPPPQQAAPPPQQAAPSAAQPKGDSQQGQKKGDGGGKKGGKKGGQPQTEGQGQPQPQQTPPGFGRGRPAQGQPQTQQPQQQATAWGRGQTQSQPTQQPPGYSQQQAPPQQQVAPPQQAWGAGRGQPPQGRGRGQPQGQSQPGGGPPGFHQQVRTPAPPFGASQQPQQPQQPQQFQQRPGFTQPQPQQQTPTQQQQQARPGGPRGPPTQQGRPGYAQAPAQQGPSQPPSQQASPAKQQGRPQQQGGRKAPSSSGSAAGDAVSRDLKKMQIAPRREDKGDDNLVSQVQFKPGKEGRVIPVESNHLSLNLGKLSEAYHYDVAIDPDVPKKFMRPVVEMFRRKHFPNRYPAFDGKKNLYASKPLSKNLSDIMADTITIQDENGREKAFKVKIEHANTVDLTPLRDLFRTPTTPREALQCVDIVLRSAPSVNLISVGRSFFSRPQSIIDLGQGMEMYSGFFQSTVRGWRPLLNVDVAHKAFPKEINVIDALAEILNSDPRQIRDLRPYEKDEFQKFMRTLKVIYLIPNQPASRREHRVNQLWTPASQARFKHDGRDMTVADYFKNVKHFSLRYPDLPTLHVGSMQREDKILLPMELCTIVAGQALNRKMTDLQTSKMIKFAATNTDIRKQKIMRGVQMANYNQSPTLQEFGFSVGNEFQKLQARVLTPPALEYQGSRPTRVSRGVWRQNDKFLKPVTINNWTIRSVLTRAPRPDDLQNLARELQNAARNCGIIFNAPPEQPFMNLCDRRPDLRFIQKHFEGLKGKYDVIFVVVPDSGEAYSYVKTAAEINVGCLTQCLKQSTLFKRMNIMTAGNILLKVNAKLAGTNHALASKPAIMKRPVMMMGADVTHPGPDAKEIPSVAAVTASHDPKCFQYNICWRLQPPTVEIIEDLENIVAEQLMFFYKKNNCKPEAIVFFRDGVSEGQFEQVKNEEVRAIQRACKRVQKDGYEPRITFLVVQKRHHIRLFPLDKRDCEDKNDNVPAGTCVDTDITHPFMQDFYLVSHASIQGVAKPTKYCTLWDDNKMSNDEIEQLTYYLCHMFTRCNRSVSYPAPTYYAHLAAARGKVYIENERLNMNRLQEEFLRYTIKEEIRKGLPMFFV